MAVVCRNLGGRYHHPGVFLAFQKRSFLLDSRKSGGSANVKRMTYSPVTVLMPRCRLRVLMPVTKWTPSMQSTTQPR